MVVRSVVRVLVRRWYLVDKGRDVEGGGYALLRTSVTRGLEIIPLHAWERRGSLLYWWF